MEEDDPEVVRLNAYPFLKWRIPENPVEYIGLYASVNIMFVLSQFRQAVYKQTMKLFAELEIKRKEREAKDMHER